MEEADFAQQRAVFALMGQIATPKYGGKALLVEFGGIVEQACRSVGKAGLRQDIDERGLDAAWRCGIGAKAREAVHRVAIIIECDQPPRAEI